MPADTIIKDSPFQRFLGWVRKNNEALVFGLNCAGSVLFAIAGGQHHNPLLVYSAAASIVATGALALPGFLKSHLPQEQVEKLRQNIRRFAIPLHHTTGLATLLSGCGVGNLPVNAAEKFLGSSTLAGSLTQFWADPLMRVTRLDKVWPFSHIDGGKGASAIYLLVIPGTIAETIRLKSIPMGIATMCYTLSIAALTQRGRDSHVLGAVLPLPASSHNAEMEPR